MSDLVEFLNARLDEDEALARRGWSSSVVVEETDFGPMYGHGYPPERVLAEVGAKRRRIAHYVEVRRLSDPVTDKHQAYVLAEGAVRKSLMFDALPYASHPDYMAEWKP